MYKNSLIFAALFAIIVLGAWDISENHYMHRRLEIQRSKTVNENRENAIRRTRRFSGTRYLRP